MMHALGLDHEHQRPDRDEYITVIYKNVMPEQMSKFLKQLIFMFFIIYKLDNLIEK